MARCFLRFCWWGLSDNTIDVLYVFRIMCSINGISVDAFAGGVERRPLAMLTSVGNSSTTSFGRISLFWRNLRADSVNTSVINHDEWYEGFGSCFPSCLASDYTGMAMTLQHYLQKRRSAKSRGTLVQSAVLRGAMYWPCGAIADCLRTARLLACPGRCTSEDAAVCDSAHPRCRRSFSTPAPTSGRRAFPRGR